MTDMLHFAENISKKVKLDLNMGDIMIEKVNPIVKSELRNETNLNSLLDEKRKETKKEVETGFQGLLDAEIEKLRNEDR